MANSHHGLLASRIDHAKQTVRAGTRFRDFEDATIADSVAAARFGVYSGRRSDRPMLVIAGAGDTETTLPWLDSRRLKLKSGA